MAYAFVNQGETSTGAATSTTIAVTYTPTAGNLLVFGVTWGTATGTASMADAGVGNTFTQFAAPLADGTANQSTHYFYALNCKGGSTTFTATVPSSQFRCIYIGEYSGTTGAPLNTAQQQQRLPTNGTDVVTSTNANATAQPALIWGFTNDYNAAAATAAGTGYTGRTLVWNYGGATSASRPEDKRVTVTGNVAATFTAGANGTEEFHTIVGIFAEVTSSAGIQIGGYDNPGSGPFRAARFPAFAQGFTTSSTAAITGAIQLDSTVTGALTGTGALVGTVALAFAPTGALTGTGALIGTVPLAFSPSAVLTGTGNMAGAIAPAFSISGTLADSSGGAIIGDIPLTLSVIGALINSSPATPSASGFGGGGAGIDYQQQRRKLSLKERPHRHLKKLLDEIGAEMLYRQLTGAAASDETQARAAKLVKPFSDDKKAEVPDAQAIDWAALERDAKRTASLVKLWLAQQHEQEILDEDDEFLFFQ